MKLQHVVWQKDWSRHWQKGKLPRGYWIYRNVGSGVYTIERGIQDQTWDGLDAISAQAIIYHLYTLPPAPRNPGR